MVAIIVALAALTMRFGELIVHDGVGWDGMTYVQWGQDFSRQMFVIGTTKYHAQRVLPAALVHYALQVGGVKPTVHNLVTAFMVFNAAMLAISAVIWSHLGHAMKWRPLVVWVGFIALFAGFANARHALYYPPLTDSAAFALGMAMTWAYLTHRPLVIYACAAMGMVTWPALAPVAIVMLLLPKQREPLPAPSQRWDAWIYIASALAAVALAFTFMRYADLFFKHPVQELGIPKFAMWVPRNYLPVTVLTLLALLAAGWYFVLHQPALWNVAALLRTIRWSHVALVLIGVALLFYARGRWLDAVATRGPGPTTAQFVCLVTLEALRGPFWGLVHHVVYFGPIILVAVLHWPAVCRVMAGWGHAATFVLALLVVFSAASESRQWIHLLPLLVAGTLAATESRWSSRAAIAFGALALCWSKLWFAIDYATPGLHMVFPQQRYFMHMGPWASNEMWFVHGMCALVTAALLYMLLRRDAATR